jgi:hypothetical protein
LGGTLKCGSYSEGRFVLNSDHRIAAKKALVLSVHGGDVQHDE